MKTASWVLIALAGVVTLLYSLLSVERAYGTYHDQLGGVKVSELSAGRPQVETAVRSRRATASAYAIGFATLLLLITAIPYRRGEVSALVGAAGRSSGCLSGGPAEDSIARHWLGRVAWWRSCYRDLGQILLVGVGLALGAGRLRHGRLGDSA